MDPTNNKTNSRRQAEYSMHRPGTYFMAMKDYASPEEYLQSMSGWQLTMVQRLREIACKSPADEQIKWGHLVYLYGGPCFLIRAEGDVVMFGFWRGQRLRDIEPRLRPGGKYEMARVDLHEDDEIAEGVVKNLVAEAIRLNDELGNPTKLS